MSDPAGQQLGSKYTLQSRIGTGGMAEVFKAKLSGAEGFEKCLVIKRLFPQYAQDPEIVGHFIAEAKLVALLQHENIAQIYDFGELDGTYFIAMEYLAGKDLHSVMQRSKEMHFPLGLNQSLYITARICAGMDFAHALRDQHQQPLHLIHRDLSPHNVFITYDGRVKVIDFGIARADLFDNKTRVGVAKGKISYMAPEQLSGEKVDHRADIFAIGILLYEMLSGRRMYSGDTATMIRKCIGVEYERLEMVRDDMPPAVHAILDRALAKDVTARYQSCGEMQAEVEECLFSIERRPSAHLLERYMDRLFSLEADRKNAEATEGAEATVVMPLVAPSLPPLSSATPRPVQGERAPKRRRLRRLLVLAAAGGLLAGVVFLAWWYQRVTPPQPSPVTVPLPVQVVPPAAEPHQEAAAPPPVPLPTPPGTEKETATVVRNESAPPSSLATEDNAAAPPPEPLPDAISLLLDQAGEILARRPIIIEGLDHAQALYQQVQEQDPTNWEARAGLARLSDLRRQVTEQAMKGGSFPRAKKSSPPEMFGVPKDGRFLSLQGVVGDQQQKTVQGMLDRAEQALRRNELTGPGDSNAFMLYREVLAIDPQNDAAHRGLAIIAERYAVMADVAFREMRLPTARALVRQGLAIDSQNRRLQELQHDLQKTKPEMFLRSIERSFSAPAADRSLDSSRAKVDSTK